MTRTANKVRPSYQEKELQTLSKLQVPCYTTRPWLGPSVWKNTEKLDIIDSFCKEKDRLLGRCSVLYCNNLEQLKEQEDIIVLSSHIDLVPEITAPHCVFYVGKEAMRGTFDNTITNAAVLNLLIENRLPDNVVVSFTGDEETGRCTGAKETIQILTSLGFSKQHIHPIALDVTYEGFRIEIEDQPVCFTVENVRYEDSHLIKIANELYKEDFPFICAPKDAYPKGTKAICRGNHSLYDEAVAYQDLVDKGVSICLPVGKGSMHSNKGVEADEQVYFGYMEVLQRFVEKYNLQLYETQQKEQDRQNPLTL